MSNAHENLIARIVALLAATDTPLESFTDSWKPGDLDDMAAELGATVADVEAARVTMARGAWYAALDAVVETISEAIGQSPIGVCYETGGHVASASWVDEDASVLVSVILSDTVEGCEFMTSKLEPIKSAASLADVVRTLRA